MYSTNPIHRFSADYIFDGNHFVHDKTLITNNAGTILDLIPTEEAGEDIGFFEGILCPGFINTHCHLELSHLKNKVSSHTGLINFLMTVTQIRNDFSHDEIALFAQRADCEMMDNGIVAVGDISNNNSSVAVKETSKLYYHTFVEAIGFLDFNAKERFSYMEKIYRGFTDAGLKASIVPHAPYSVSPSLFRLINDFDQKDIISIHNQECEDENRLYETGKSDFTRLYRNLGIDISRFHPSGDSSLKSWLPYFTHPHPLILVHNTFTEESDVVFAEKSGRQVFWCLCPNANKYIENRMPPVELLLKYKAKVVLGTDSIASNHQLSILEEMKTLQQHFPQTGLETMLSWATQNGAEALNCENKFGSFKKGKTPGILHISPVRKDTGGEILLAESVKVERIK